jgi:hypothetical protein
MKGSETDVPVMEKLATTRANENEWIGGCTDALPETRMKP